MVRGKDFLEAEIAHVSRPIPQGLGIVEKSVPITAFGKFDEASVATLSLNPSYLEFTNQKGSHLPNEKNRVFSRFQDSLEDDDSLSRETALKTIDSFRKYFDLGSNPYLKWFGPMENKVLSSVGASYFDGSATHLDLSQWATNPIWNKLSEETKQALLDSDLPFLKRQLEHRKFDLVLINGSTAIREISKTGLVEMKVVDEQQLGKTTVVFYQGQALGTKFLAWNWYLQSAISEQVRDAIAHWLKSQL
jgi:hypothetical protein